MVSGSAPCTSSRRATASARSKPSSRLAARAEARANCRARAGSSAAAAPKDARSSASKGAMSVGAAELSTAGRCFELLSQADFSPGCRRFRIGAAESSRGAA